MNDVCRDLLEPEENDNPSASDLNSVKKKWEQCLSLLEKEVPWQTYQTWFIPINPITYVDGILTLRLHQRLIISC